MKARTLLFWVALVWIVGFVVFAFVWTSQAQEDQPGIPRDAFVASQFERGFDSQGELVPLVSAQAVAMPPARIQEAYRAGGVALVFGCYNSDSPNLDEFDSELPLIAATGARHVRLTCSMDVLENGTTGKVRTDRYAKVLEFVNLAWSYGLLTTVDVHNTGMREPGNSNWTDNYMWGVTNPSVAARHTSLVVDLLSKLAQDVPHDRFVFQPANEPIDQSNWYTYQQSYFPQLRAVCSDCTIMVMARDWQGLEETVYSLNLAPFNGPIIVDVHFYEPIDMTHCSYPGSANRCGGQQYPGTHTTWRGTIYYDIAWLRNHFNLLKNWANSNNVFINMGEFGSTADLAGDVQARYFADLATIFRENFWGYTAYEWYHNFGIKQNPSAVSALFSGQPNPVSPTPGVTLTPIPTITATPSITLTPVPGVTSTLDFDETELLNLVSGIRMSRDNLNAMGATATAVNQTYTSAQATMSAVQAQQNQITQMLQAALANFENARQALIDYIEATFLT